jgi:hypothetical protein
LCSVSQQTSPYMIAAQPNHEVCYNYWNQPDPNRFSLPSYFYTPDMYDTTQTPLCGEFEATEALMSMSEALYVQAGEAQLAGDNAEAYAINQQLLLSDTGYTNPLALYAQINMTMLMHNAGQDTITSLRQQLVSIAESSDVASARSAAAFNATKTYLAEGATDSAVEEFARLSNSSESVIDSVTALVDSSLVRGIYPEAQMQSAGYSESCHEKVSTAQRRTDWSQSKIIALHELLNNERNRIAPIPLVYALHQNYPNPFNATTVIRFDLPEAVKTQIRVFNILGQEVATLVDELRPAGAHQIIWDSRSSTGDQVASGIYIYQIKAGNFVDSKKMVLIR